MKRFVDWPKFGVRCVRNCRQETFAEAPDFRSKDSLQSQGAPSLRQGRPARGQAGRPRHLGHDGRRRARSVQRFAGHALQRRRTARRVRCPFHALEAAARGAPHASRHRPEGHLLPLSQGSGPWAVAADSAEPVARRVLIALPAGQPPAEGAVAALGGGGPRPVRPRWVVAHMLVVAALEFGDPVPLVVPVKAHDALVHRFPVPGARSSQFSRPRPRRHRRRTRGWPPCARGSIAATRARRPASTQRPRPIRCPSAPAARCAAR